MGPETSACWSYSQGLLFHEPKSLFQEEPSSNSLMEHLKATLSQALDIFHPVAGRLAALALTENEGQTSSLFLSVMVTELGLSMQRLKVPHWLTFSSPSLIMTSFYSFFPAKGVLNCQGISKALLAVQVTELVDGMFIGCSPNHSVGNGTSFCHFIHILGPKSLVALITYFHNPHLILVVRFEEGSIDFEACLLPGTLQAMVEDTDFIDRTLAT
ncbi:hypothetical protein FNV43_RR17254 [Rhamnella rubrinervis]|uniref:Uncharacterized protein n=1 Tax=Rhamnella rubrinervis TaxID=2594499 RepID=A0A8K0E3S1_9ROSA|nr:hypothetical protein FNV43_RR17254 [Rhamnella rubrinervis]